MEVKVKSIVSRKYNIMHGWTYFLYGRVVRDNMLLYITIYNKEKLDVILCDE